MFSKEVAFESHLFISVAVVLLCLTCATMQGAPFECFAVSDLVLPASAIGWNFVGSIPIAENTPKYRKTDVFRKE